MLLDDKQRVLVIDREKEDSTDDELNSYSIIAIIVAVIMVLIIALLVFVYFYCKRKR